MRPDKNANESLPFRVYTLAADLTLDEVCEYSIAARRRVQAAPHSRLRGDLGG